MGTANSTRRRSGANDFPLWKHSASGQWAKKIRGRVYFFGTDRQDALNHYLDARDDLLAERAPPTDTAELTIADLCDRFLNFKEHLVKSRELSSRTFADFLREAKRLTQVLGRDRVVAELQPDDFLELRKSITTSRGKKGTKDSIIRIRSILKFAYDEQLIDAPVPFGQTFKIPSKQHLRIEQASRPNRILTAEQIRQLIAEAKPHMKAAVWLGINCALGNTDVGRLEQSHVDFSRRWLVFPRSKTGSARECPLWEETAAALQVALEIRPAPAQPRYGRRFLLTAAGTPYAKMDAKKGDPFGVSFRRTLRRQGMAQPGLGFYLLRHSFLTVAESGCNDPPAIRRIMGHSERESDMASNDRESIDPQRLTAVTDCVYGWLMDRREG